MSLTGTVDRPCSFTLAPGVTLPSGVSFSTVSPTQCRFSFSASVALGSFNLAVDETPL